ncbi:PREDICTED: uncharacterized protein LOC109117274 [Tarenaya hassleriana]|uniref:uncharacterized protein LOC109117274 n=1 Tax=Tarenaya hassleriana TaxID=28532 RepID=UPI0008FD25EE|nr:PREDICTED: uncharacterized protein LOC109117274 [Tarenaya hassleriana]
MWHHFQTNMPYPAGARPEGVPAPIAVDYLPLIRELRMMEIASHHLFGEALHWWEEVVREAAPDHQFTWEEFKAQLEEKYCQKGDQDHRIVEFLHLEQGDRTLPAYEAEFTRLLRYGSHLVPTEKLKIQKFVTGLRPYLRRRIEIQEYPMLSRYMTQLHKLERREQEEQQEERNRDSSPMRRITFTRPSSSSGQMMQPRDRGRVPAVHPTAPSPPALPGPRRSCPRCGRDDVGPCRSGYTYYRCGQPDHFANQCTGNVATSG